MSFTDRRLLLIPLVTCFITWIALASSPTLANAQPLESETIDRFWTSAGIAAPGDPDEAQQRLTFATSLEYEFPEPPPERTREYCKSISRFCDWLAGYDALVDPDPDDAESEALEPDDAEDGSASNGVQTGSQNRSVVGWSSASISTINSQKQSAPVSLEVSSLSISAAVRGVGINEDRSMEIPDDYNTVGWYRHGSAPGDPVSSVIAGHLDDVRGRSVFYDLQHVEIGARVSVTLPDGRQKHFQVVEKRAYDADNLPSAEVFSRNGDPRLTLLTCGGSWDRSPGRYSETVAVIAEPV